jgi:hypothetical protein
MLHGFALVKELLWAPLVELLQAPAVKDSQLLLAPTVLLVQQLFHILGINEKALLVS